MKLYFVPGNLAHTLVKIAYNMLENSWRQILIFTMLANVHDARVIFSLSLSPTLARLSSPQPGHASLMVTTIEPCSPSTFIFLPHQSLMASMFPYCLWLRATIAEFSSSLGPHEPIGPPSSAGTNQVAVPWYLSFRLCNCAGAACTENAKKSAATSIMMDFMADTDAGVCVCVCVCVEKRYFYYFQS